MLYNERLDDNQNIRECYFCFKRNIRNTVSVMISFSERNPIADREALQKLGCIA